MKKHDRCITQIGIATLTCWAMLSRANEWAILFDGPVSKGLFECLWQTNYSVYSSCKQITISEPFSLVSSYQCWVVDIKDTNPGHGYGQRPFTHIDPVMQYYTSVHGNPDFEKLNAIEVYNKDGYTFYDVRAGGNHEVLMPTTISNAYFLNFCAELGFIQKDFQALFEKERRQLWQNTEINDIWTDVLKSEKSYQSIRIRYENNRVYSVMAVRDKIHFPVYHSLPLPSEHGRTNIMDLSYLLLQRFQIVDTGLNANWVTLIEDIQKRERVIRDITRNKNRSNQHREIFARMRSEDITFEKEVTTLGFPVSSCYGYYSSTNGITVRTKRERDPLLRTETIDSIFVDFRQLPRPSVVLLPDGNVGSPLSLQECTEQFTILSERRQYDGEYVYVVCENKNKNRLQFLFKNKTIVGLCYGKLLGRDDGLWELVDWLNIKPHF